MVFPIGYEKFPQSNIRTARNRLTNRNIDIDIDGTIIFCFIGQFESTLDIETLVTAIKNLSPVTQRIAQFIFCGDGRDRPLIDALETMNSNVHCLGWVNSSIIEDVLTISDIGLCCYADKAPQSLPNKPFEYLAGGLGLLSSLRSELDDIIESSHCGWLYNAGDPENLKNMIEQIARNPIDIKKKQQNARLLFRSRYSADLIYKTFAKQVLALTHQKNNGT
jgi:glycosyltransferase involved in cell wall biosynthesis